METKKKKRKKGKKSVKNEKSKKLDIQNKIYLNQEPPKEGEQFTDNLFPPDENSLLGKNRENKVSSEIEAQKKYIITSEIEWCRSKKILIEPHLFEGEIGTNNISPGIIINTYFISAVECLCKYPYLISKIFITKEYDKDKCFFELLLFIDGEFQIVYLDDYFPCIKGTSVPYFTKPTTFELWFMLLEKAWAKINGGYGNILVGNPSQIFRFLTGFCCEQIDNVLFDEQNYLNLLKNSNDSKEVMCLSTKDGDDVEQMGLIKGHNYIIINVVEINDKDNEKIMLFKLKNPIPSDNIWKGDWSNESDNWTEEINNQLNEDEIQTNKNEFYINIHDILKYFNRTDICHILFNSYSQKFEFNEAKNLNEAQIFNFYLDNKGKVSISVSNYLFPYPISLVLIEYDPENINIKNIYTDFESDKDIEKTISLNEGYYLLWIYKHFLDEEDDKNKNMKVKILSENQLSIKYIGPDNDFQLIQQIIYEQTKEEKEKENLLKEGEIFHYSSQKWIIDASETKDFSIISPKLNPKEPFPVYLEENDFAMIIAIRNKKYGQFIFNTKIEAEEYTNYKGKAEKTEKNLRNFEFLFSKDKTNLEQITTKETGSLEELSKKEEFPILDHAKIFAEKYKKKYKLIEEVVEMEKDENDEKNKNLRWVKIKKDNGIYLGEADQNIPQGRGCFIYNGKENEELKWIGYFDNGDKSNFGKLYNEEGRLIYEGEYKNGLRNGEGTYYYARGLKYEGQFVNGLREGHGVFYWEDGTRWEGPFKNNEMEGEGKYYDKEECYPVEYKNGEIVS